ncbi:hypothetical protein ZIOFF_048739 [Zingiber officinale]|uniref:Uncharacterized protein n=1 Tax=Zingiber officinale TaxID=94328 RepID=A0A8J5FQ51_ZINOF|nr:hypothetical protein ZIOFF_048739 [Zingiber officinale]
MESNYEAWVHGFAPLAVGADVPAAVREFSRTLFNMRPDISLFVSRTVFNSDLRGVLGFVTAPCVIIQTAKDVSVPLSVAFYLKDHLGGRATVELLPCAKSRRVNPKTKPYVMNGTRVRFRSRSLTGSWSSSYLMEEQRCEVKISPLQVSPPVI